MEPDGIHSGNLFLWGGSIRHSSHGLDGEDECLVKEWKYWIPIESLNVDGFVDGITGIQLGLQVSRTGGPRSPKPMRFPPAPLPSAEPTIRSPPKTAVYSFDRIAGADISIPTPWAASFYLAIYPPVPDTKSAMNDCTNRRTRHRSRRGSPGFDFTPIWEEYFKPQPG